MSEEAHVSLYKYTDHAGDLLPIFEGVSGVALYQVQIRAHLVCFFDLFNDFLRSGDYPNLNELSLQAGVRLVLTRRDDPDMVGIVPWRIAFYVAGTIDSLNNFLMLLDDFWIYLAKNGRVYEVHMHPHINVNIYSEDFSYGRYIMNDPANELSCGVFEAGPPMGLRIVTLYLKAESEFLVSVVLTGNTWVYRDSLEDAGVIGARVGEGADSYYVRVLSGIDVTDAHQRDNFYGILGGKVFKNRALLVRVDDDDDPTFGMPVAEFIIELLKVPSVHFDDSVKEFRRKYFDRPVAQVCDHDGTTTATNLGGDEIATFPTSDIESRRALGKNYVIV